VLHSIENTILYFRQHSVDRLLLLAAMGVAWRRSFSFQCHPQ